MAARTLEAESAQTNLLQFPAPRPRLRADVPAFDPSNPAHLRAWESLFDFGRMEIYSREGR